MTKVREVPRGQPVSREADFVVVRPARKNDASALGAFFLRAWKEAGPGALGFTGATEDAIKIIASEEFLARRLTSPNVRLVVAERGNEILGFASLRLLEKAKTELTGIVVIGSASGGGVGTRLLRKACESGSKLGYREVVVKTEAANDRAIRFYKDNGFTETRKAVEKIGRVKVPVLILEKILQRSSRRS